MQENALPSEAAAVVPLVVDVGSVVASVVVVVVADGSSVDVVVVVVVRVSSSIDVLSPRMSLRLINFATRVQLPYTII